MFSEELLLSRAGIQSDFSEPLLEEAQALRKQLIFNNRHDWTKIPTFTIDSEKTKDYDDAISFIGWTGSNISIAIQISDAAGILSPKSSLFDEALNRISSLYGVQSNFPMLPLLLSEDFLSLRAGKKRAVVSFVFQLFRHGNWILKDIVPGIIKVDQNLSYADVNQMISSLGSPWKVLEVCCQSLRKKRIENGASDIPRKEVSIDAQDPDTIRIHQVDRNNAANYIVQELAILVNQEVGRLFYKNKWPAIYRSQAPHKENYESTSDLKQTLQFEPVVLSTLPNVHAGIACAYYCQVTSPIRRFIDLVNQFQLHSYLQKKAPLFQEDHLTLWAQKAQKQQKRYTQVERDIIHHWKTRYLGQQQAKIFKALFTRSLSNDKSEVELEELLYRFQMPGLPKMSKGQAFYLSIESVNLENNQILAKVCSPPPD